MTEHAAEASNALGDLVERFDHVSMAVWNISTTLPLMDLLNGTYLKGGDQKAEGFRWAQWALPTAGKLEVIEPLDPDDTDNFVVRFLAERGEGIHHLTFKVTDLAAAVAKAEGLGFKVVGVNTDHANWKEAFVHPKSANGVLVQIAEWRDATEPGELTLDDVLSTP